MRTNWIPFSRPNWKKRDILAAKQEYRGYDAPETGSKAPAELQERLADFWAVPRKWVLLTSSCTEAIALWADYRIFRANWPKLPTVRVPGLTWPGTYCAVRGRKYCEDLVRHDVPIHCKQDDMSLRIAVRLYGCHHGPLEPNSLIDSAHDVGFQPATYLNAREYGAVAYSFGPVKELSSLGGGALVSPLCADGDLQLMASSGVNEFREPALEYARKCRILPSSAACVLSQLDRIGEDKSRRLKCLDWYSSNTPREIKVFNAGSGHLAVLYFPSVEMCTSFRIAMHKRGVRTGHHYRPPVHFERDLPNALHFSYRICTVPCFARWRKGEWERVKSATLRALEELGSPSDRGG